MLKIDPTTKSLAWESRRQFRPISFFERYSLAEFLSISAREFFADAGLDLFVLGREIPLNAPPHRPVDMLLCNDAGLIYVAALQDRRRSPDLTETLEQAGIVSTWDWRRATSRLNAEDIERLKTFLRCPIEEINRSQGIILAAETFDQESLSSSSWLRQRYSVPVYCLRVRAATDRVTGEQFLTCRELTGAVKRSAGTAKGATEPTAPEPVAAKQAAEQAVAEADPPAAIVKEGSRTIKVTKAPAADPIAAVLDSSIKRDNEQLERDERRSAPRSRDFQALRLRIDYCGRLLAARLVDFSKTGIGIEALSPLPVGAEVTIDGELVGGESAFGLDGRVRVAHCRPRRDGICRIGLRLEGSVLQPLNDVGQDFDRR